MTYFDREKELFDSALSVIYEKLVNYPSLTLNEPFTCILQTGKSVSITGIEKISENEIQFLTDTNPIPAVRLESTELMRLVDTVITEELFRNSQSII